MKYLIYFNNNEKSEKIAIKTDNGTIKYFISGDLDSYNHTVILSNIFNKEIGRLYQERTNIFNSYSLDIVGRNLIKIKKINIHYLNLLFLTEVKYFVQGNIKRGNYSFTSGLKSIATVKTKLDSAGITLSCNINNQSDVPIVLLTCILFTRWNILKINLPEFNKKMTDLNPSFS